MDGGAAGGVGGGTAGGVGGGSDAGSPDAGTVADPNLDGPTAFTEFDATTVIPATGDNVPLHVAAPTAGGPYPLVVFAHGMQLPPSQYYGYLKRLASHGYVAMTVDFPASLFSVNNPKQAQDLLGGVDWALSDSRLTGKVDVARVGISGHSLGGKLALLAATLDPRVKAVFVLDPVDGTGGQSCSPPGCVVVSSLLPGLNIPTGFIGETTDATGSFMACAPAAFNFTTFYAKATAPSLQVTALGANHMSFLDDVSSCGFTCSFCNAATASNAQVNDLSRALMVAFYQRRLNGLVAYDTYLTGAQAQARYVATNQATIVSK